MVFNKINEQLKNLNTDKGIDDALILIKELVSILGLEKINEKELLIHQSIQAEKSRFVNAPGFRNQAAAYELPHESNIPLDLKLFWIDKINKANLSWLVALTPNYEDDPDSNPNANIGIDFVLNKECDRLFIVLSRDFKLRVLELHNNLSHTQREIIQNWVNISNDLDKKAEGYKKKLQKHLWQSFDFEPINRKFYQELVTQFDHLVGHLKNSITEDEARMFSIRFIGRLLFLWFLRKKEFINTEIDYFSISGSSDQTKYYREKLEPLFFEVLNVELKNRNNKDKVTPFLNGGLFEPIESDFYKDNKLTFPDGFFTQLYSILNHYNFTVDEGTSKYENVAIDPEMLGRVFENLLASVIDETEKQARKAKGAFYTPREIVDYMCEQTLIECLKSKLSDSPNRDRRINEIVTMNEAEFRGQDHNKRRDWKKDLGKEDVIQALDNIKILDPAVGSGAFPMGMLSILIKVYTRIDTSKEKDPAILKRDILARSLYGVDIDQMAIQICRLRAWLTILVDIKATNKIDPLPNLDFKFVCANTLIPLAIDREATLLGDSQKEELIKLRDEYYNATRKKIKEDLRKGYISKISDGGLFEAIESERLKQLRDYNPFDSLNSSGFYDPELMQGVSNFDIVIGNPPYISALSAAKTISKDIRVLYKELYKAASGTYDIYLLFFERGLELLNKNGILTFITPTKYLSAKYAEAFRTEVAHEKLFLLTDFSQSRVFESAGVTTFISMYKNEFAEKDIVTNIYEGVNLERKSIQLKHSKDTLTYFPENIWGHLITNNFNLLKKIYDQSIPFDKNNKVNGSSTAAEADSFSKYISDNKEGIKIINTGTIREYLSLWGEKDYLNKKTKILKPFLAFKDINERRFGMYKTPKVVIPKLTKKLKCVIDWEGVYASTNTTFVYDFKEENHVYLVGALLNSKLYDFMYKHIFSGLNMLGSYQFQAPQIRVLPFPKNIEGNVEKDIVDSVKLIIKDKIVSKESQERLDDLVMDIYKLNNKEKEIIRSS